MKSLINLGLLKGAKGNEYNLTFVYMDNCSVEDIKNILTGAYFQTYKNMVILIQAQLMKKILILKIFVNLNMN